MDCITTTSGKPHEYSGPTGLLKEQVHLTSLGVISDEDLIESLAQGDTKKAAALREILGAPNTFDTPGGALKPIANGGNPHGGAGEAGAGQGKFG